MDSIGTTIMVTYLLIKLLQLIWSSCTCRFHLPGAGLQTRTTRTPSFWGYPRPSWLPILLSHIESQVKWRQSQSYKFKEFVKILNFGILKQTLQEAHLLKLLDKMCKYEMDPTSIVEDTEQTRFCLQMDKVKPVYPLFNFVEAEGMIKLQWLNKDARAPTKVLTMAIMQHVSLHIYHSIFCKK